MFEPIITRGGGAIGIQISVPIGKVHVRNGIETLAGVGASLARGVATNLFAIALSLKREEERARSSLREV